jgi:hypothetical protein
MIVSLHLHLEFNHDPYALRLPRFPISPVSKAQLLVIKRMHFVNPSMLLSSCRDRKQFVSSVFYRWIYIEMRHEHTQKTIESGQQ